MNKVMDQSELVRNIIDALARFADNRKPFPGILRNYIYSKLKPRLSLLHSMERYKNHFTYKLPIGELAQMVKATKVLPPLRFVYLLRQHRHAPLDRYIEKYNLAKFWQLFASRHARPLEELILCELCRVELGELYVAVHESHHLCRVMWAEVIETQIGKELVELDVQRFAKKNRLAEIWNVLSRAEMADTVLGETGPLHKPDLAAPEHGKP